MKLFKRIVSCFLTFSILISLMNVSAHAAASDSSSSFGTSKFWEWLVSNTRLDNSVGITDYFNSIFSTKDSGCTSSNGYHLWRLASDLPVGTITNSFVVQCAYCGAYYSDYTSESTPSDVYDAYVSTLDSPVVNSSGVYLYYPSGWYIGSSTLDYLYSSSISSYDGGFIIDGYLHSAMGYSGSFTTYSSKFVLPDGVYSFSQDFFETYNTYPSGATFTLFAHKKGDSSDTYSSIKSPFSTDNYDSYCFACKATYNTGSTSKTLSSGRRINYEASVHLESLQLDIPVSHPSNSTRPASLMQTINNYNEDNSYTDNSETVNYYIGTVDAGGDVTNIYNVNLYDEETLIFTEPFTGAQYQTTGWTYDYTTRCYTLDLSSGTFALDGSDIDKVKLTYGDDLLTLDYYSGSTLVESDEYAYVRAAQSECALNGHTYTYETVREATCTTPGERKYTCSVCGNEYAEEIPVIGHAYEYSIYQEPTCLESGIGIYTCSMCGDQYTEPIEPKGHTPEMIEYVPTEYDENGTAVSVGYTLYRCTVCGTEYKVNDEIDIKDESWFSWLASLFKKLISAIVNGLASGLEYLVENVIVTVTDLLVQFTRWSFGLLDVDSLTDWFNWFSDDNEYFANDFGGSEVDVWAYS